MKNLIVAVCGDESLHQIWTRGENDFDLFVIYYGNSEGRYAVDGRYYERAKGTKFNIVAEVAKRKQDVFDSYDAIFVPDDDIYFTAPVVNKFFELFHQYNLQLAQPAVFGWISIPLTAAVPLSILRYTNWVEIMCPCFRREAFAKCLPSFSENRTNWGIEFLWSKHIDTNAHNTIAIIDAVVATHTRPCFFGDTYQNNQNTLKIAMGEAIDLLKKYGLTGEYRQYSTVFVSIQDFNNRKSEHKFVPDAPYLKDLIPFLRRQNKVLL